MSLDDNKSAIELLKTLLQINPEYPGARSWYSRTLSELGNKIEAAEVKYEDLKSKPNGELGMGVSPYGWTDCAEYYFLGNQFERAKEILDEYFTVEHNVTAYEKDNSAPYRLYAKILRAEDKFTEAIEMCNKALIQKRTVPTDHELYVWLLIDLKRYDEAIVAYDKMIKEIFGGMDRFLELQPLKNKVEEIRLITPSN